MPSKIYLLHYVKCGCHCTSSHKTQKYSSVLWVHLYQISSKSVNKYIKYHYYYHMFVRKVGVKLCQFSQNLCLLKDKCRQSPNKDLSQLRKERQIMGIYLDHGHKSVSTVCGKMQGMSRLHDVAHVATTWLQSGHFSNLIALTPRN